MREKLQRFMSGRNGTDDLSKCCLVVAMAALIISMFSRWTLFYILGLVLLIYAYWRTFSKNVPKRYEENQKYLNFRYQTVVKKEQWKKRFAGRKIYRYFKCPQCRQRVRVPKGKGKICITCPKCRTEFVKRS
jgi:predicted membrane protein